MQAAIHAKESGFDAIEIHMGHGYLLAQFITPFYNTRKDIYGGNIDNRMRYPKEVLSKVLDAVGNDIAVTVKFSQTDGKIGGNTIEEGIEIAKKLAKDFNISNSLSFNILKILSLSDAKDFLIAFEKIASELLTAYIALIKSSAISFFKI